MRKAETPQEPHFTTEEMRLLIAFRRMSVAQKGMLLGTAELSAMRQKKSRPDLRVITGGRDE